MSHPAQQLFILQVRNQFPEYFTGKRVLECGSLNINGTVRDFFQSCDYTGIDLAPGPCVDVVCPTYEWNHLVDYDVVVSTEMLEHSDTWYLDLDRMCELLRPGGLLLLTAAGDGRPEHGTRRTTPQDSPHTGDYYRNISNDMALGRISRWYWQELLVRQVAGDFQCYGIKA